MQADALAKAGEVEIGVLDVPAHGEIRAVDLQHEAGFGDGLVFVTHGVGDGVDVALEVLVVIVAEEQRDDAGRGRAHEAARRFHAGERGSEIVSVDPRRLFIAHRDRRVAGRRLAPRAAGIAEYAALQAREIGEVLIDEGVAAAAETVEPVLDVGRVARLRHFAVVDQIDAGLGLFAYHLGDRIADARRERGRIDRHAFLLGVHHTDQVVRARQAAGVGGEKSFAAPLHPRPRLEGRRTLGQPIAADQGWGGADGTARPRSSAFALTRFGGLKPDGARGASGGGPLGEGWGEGVRNPR